MPLVTEEQALEALSLIPQLENPEDRARATRIARGYETQQKEAGAPLFPNYYAQRQEEQIAKRQKIRGYFQDRDNHGLSEENLQGLNQQFEFDPEGKAAVFNTEWIADSYQLTREQAEAMRPELIKAYSEREWGEAIETDSAFAERLAQQFDFEDEIENRAIQTALSGSAAFDSLAAMEADFLEDPRYKGREKKAKELFQASYENVKNQVSPYNALASDFTEQLQISMGVKEGEEALPDEWFLEQVMQIPEEDRQLFFQAVAARAGEGESKLIGQKMLERFGRSAGDLYRKGGQVKQIRFLEEAKKELLREKNELVDEIPEEFGFDAGELFTTLRSSSATFEQVVREEVEVPEQGSEEFNALPEETQQKLIRLDEEIQYVRLYQEINDIATGVIDPAEAAKRDYVGKALLGVSSSLPNIGLMALGPAGVAVNVKTYQDSASMDLMRQNPGMSASDVESMGAMIGVGQGLLDYIPLKVLQGKTPGLARYLNQATITNKSIAARAGVRIATGSALEFGQETAQDLGVPALVQGIASALNEDIPGYDWDSHFADFTSDENLSELIPTVVLMSLIGGGAGTYRDVKAARSLLSDYDALRVSGMSEAAASDIRNLARSGDLDGAQTRLREEFRQLGQDTKDISEVRAEVATEARVERDKRIELITSGEELDLLPAIRQENDSFSLIFNDGSQGPAFETREEAHNAAFQFAEDNNLSIHEATRNAIQQVERDLGNGREVKYIFDPKQMTRQRAIDEGLATEEALQNREQIAQEQQAQGRAEPQQSEEVDLDTEYQTAITNSDLSASREEARNANSIILGSNVTEFADGVHRTTVRLYQDASPLTVIEEKTEGDADIMIRQLGLRKWMVNAMREWEQVSGDRVFLKDKTDEELTNGDIKEAWSHLAQSYFVGRSRKGDVGDRWGSKEFRKIAAELMRTPLGGTMTAYGEFFKSVWKRAAKLNKLRREGKLDEDLERELARSVGISEQQEYNEGVISEAAKMREELDEGGGIELEPDEVSEFQATDDAPFSVIEKGSRPFAFSPDGEVGFSVLDYQGQHRPPMRGEGGPGHDLSEIYPDDIYGPDGAQFYGHYGQGSKMDRDTIEKIGLMRDMPDRRVLIYRAIPDDVDQEEINAGDWVTINKEYAEEHGEGPLGGNYRILQSNVPAKHIFTDGNSIHEWGYDPSEEISFSTVTDPDSRIAAMFSPFQRSPELRLKIAQEMKRRGVEEAQKWAPILAANRTKKDIEQERKDREAELIAEKLDSLSPATLGALESQSSLDDVAQRPILSELLTRKTTKTKSGKDHSYWASSLMSKAEAKRRGFSSLAEWEDMPDGLSNYTGRGSITPDQAADQFGFESVAEFWDALAKEVESYRERNQEAVEAQQEVRALEKEAREESRAWAEEQQRLSDTVGSDRATLLGGLRTLDAIISALPAEVRGKIGGFVKLAQLKTPRSMLEEIERRTERINRELERYLKAEADENVKKLFKRIQKSRQTKAGKKAKGRLGEEFYAVADKAKEAQSLYSGERVEIEAAALEAQSIAEGISTEDATTLKLQSEMVRLFGDWGNQDAATKTAAYETLKDLFDGAWFDALEREAVRRERWAGMREDAQKSTGSTGSEKERRAKKRAQRKAMSKGWLNFQSFEYLAAWAFGENSQIHLDFADRQRKAENTRDDAVQAIHEGVDDFFTNLAGGRLKGERLQYRMSQESIDTEHGKFSELEAIDVILTWNQEQGQRHMLGKRDENGDWIDSPNNWRFDESFVETLKDGLKREGWQFMQFLQDEYGKEWGRIDPVYRAVNGVSLPRNDQYAPISVKPFQEKSDSLTDPFSGTPITANATPGSFRTRGTAIARPEFQNALEKYLAHKKQIEHWLAYAELIQDARNVLGSREVSDSVEGSSGKEARAMLSRWVNFFTEGGTRDAAAHLEFSGRLNEIAGRFASMALVGRFGTLAIQSTQLGAAAAEMPTTAYLSRLGKLMTGNLKWGDSLRSDYIQRRLKQMPPIVRQAMEGLDASKPNAIKHAAQRMGQLLSGADAVFTAGTYAIVYDHRLSLARSNGLSGPEAEQYARNEAERITDRIAQPTRQGARSFFENASTNPLARLSWNFASEARKNIALGAFAVATKDPVRVARAALYVIAINGFMATAIRNAWRDARSEEDDEIFDDQHWRWKRFFLLSMTDWLYGVPMIGEELQNAIMSGAGEWTFGGSSLSAIPNSVPAFKRLFLEGDTDELLRDVESIMTAIGLGNDTAAATTSFLHIARDVNGLLKNFTQ